MVSLSITCITAIVDNVDKFRKSVKKNIFKTLPSVYFEALNIEDITTYVKKDEKKCLFYCVVTGPKLHWFFSFLSKTNTQLLKDSTWVFLQDNHNISIDSKLAGLNSDINFLEEKNGTVYVKEVYSINDIYGLIENIYGQD